MMSWFAMCGFDILKKANYSIKVFSRITRLGKKYQSPNFGSPIFSYFTACNADYTNKTAATRRQ